MVRPVRGTILIFIVINFLSISKLIVKLEFKGFGYTLFISNPDSKKIEVTLKINKQDIRSIIKDFERHDYIVQASYKEEEVDSDFTDRYESLMRFLNP